MKETIVRACGHTETVEVFGSAKQRESKLKWLANYDCAACREAAKAAGCREVEMHYGEYKTNYADYDTKKGSYDKKTKTIIVYVPIDEIKEETVNISEPETAATSEEPKYNKSDIMKRAWDLYRNAKGNFSECLKYAWAEAKGIIKKLIAADIPEKLVFQAVTMGAKLLQERLEYAKANLMHVNHSERACHAMERAIKILG